MGRLAGASFMLIKNLEKLRKRTLRERIYEEVVRLILAGELPSGGWVDEKRVIDKLRVSRTPFREAIGILAKGGLVEITVQRMSNHDIRRLENTLIETGAALQRGDTKTYAMLDREFYENIAEQSENSALIEALARAALQIQLCGTIASVSPEFVERVAHGCGDIIQAFKARDIPRAAFLVRGRINHTQEAIPCELSR